jgi:tRNA threonylcarbamoyladenosine biosynthesis protein TsaB
MHLLAIETSTPTARVAVLDASGAVVAGREATADRHSANVLRLCDEVLRGAGLRARDLQAIACGAGPGSFTGLRVGLAVAKGLVLAGGAIPLVLVSSLRALALDALRGAPDAVVVATIDAGKGQIYAGFFRSHPTELVEPLGEDLVLTPAELCAHDLAASGGRLWVGPGIERHVETFDLHLPAAGQRVKVAGPTPASLGALALLRLARGEADDLDRAVPAYGRPPDITRKKAPPTPGKPPG